MTQGETQGSKSATEKRRIVTPEVRAMIGKVSRKRTDVDVVSASDIRRWVIATLDDNPVWYDEAAAKATGFGLGCAPGPFMIRAVSNWKRALGTPDPVRDLDYEDDLRADTLEFPELKIPWADDVGTFHGGDDVEYFRLARVGDRVSMNEQIVDIEEKQGRSGPFAIVHINQEYTNQDGAVLAINHATRVARVMPKEGWREKGSSGRGRTSP